MNKLRCKHRRTDAVRACEKDAKCLAVGVQKYHSRWKIDSTSIAGNC